MLLTLMKKKEDETCILNLVMVKNCVYEIVALPFYIDTIYKKTHGQKHL